MFKSIGNVFKSIFKFVGQVFKAILNSSLNMDGTELYYLLNKNSGAIDRIGVT
ncbi:hypothetical protein [Hyphomicrobium sp.]|uniref:hypothetical protein n=1 Tax=Hyphomicrobium sp. TaxID=82 RepID=UPI003F7267B0